jgi:hypothetical protein
VELDKAVASLFFAAESGMEGRLNPFEIEGGRVRSQMMEVGSRPSKH